MKSILGILLAAAICQTARSAETKCDLEYGQAGGERLLLDACAPDGAGPFPVVIIVHGGGWGGGDKAKDTSVFFDPLTQGGFTWFSINYRLAPTNHWPACFEDVQTAIRWVKAHAAEFKGDPRRIALLGYSAGGQLACHAAVLAGDDTRVQAVVACAAPTDMVADNRRRDGLSKSLQALLARPPELTDDTIKILHELSPFDFVKPGLPPFLLLQGNADKTVPPSQSANFQAKLRSNNVPCDLITLTNAQHRILDWEKFDAGYKEKTVAWLRKTLIPAPQ